MFIGDEHSFVLHVVKLHRVIWRLEGNFEIQLRAHSGSLIVSTELSLMPSFADCPNTFLVLPMALRTPRLYAPSHRTFTRYKPIQLVRLRPDINFHCVPLLALDWQFSSISFSHYWISAIRWLASLSHNLSDVAYAFGQTYDSGALIYRVPR